MGNRYVIKQGDAYWAGGDWTAYVGEAIRYVSKRPERLEEGERYVRLVPKNTAGRASATLDWAKSAILAAVDVDAEREAIAARMCADAATDEAGAEAYADDGDYADAATSVGCANSARFWAGVIRERKGKPAGAK